MNFVDRSQIDSDNYAKSCMPAKKHAEPQIRDKAGIVVCRECGEPIPEKRLQAIPDAAYCRDCAEEIEKAGQNHGKIDDYVKQMPIKLIY